MSKAKGGFLILLAPPQIARELRAPTKAFTHNVLLLCPRGLWENKWFCSWTNKLSSISIACIMKTYPLKDLIRLQSIHSNVFLKTSDNLEIIKSMEALSWKKNLMIHHHSLQFLNFSFCVKLFFPVPIDCAKLVGCLAIYKLLYHIWRHLFVPHILKAVIEICQFLLKYKQIFFSMPNCLSWLTVTL